MELIIEGIHEALAGGPLADEPVQNLKMTLVDVKLHEDAIHRGPAQVIPAVRSAIKAGMLIAGDSLLEPIQKIQITVPMDQMGAATSQIQGRRGQVFDMQSEGDTITVVGKAPVAELFGFAGDIRSATEGRAMWNTEFAGFELVPNNMVKEVVVAIRKRKGLKEQMPTPAITSRHNFSPSPVFSLHFSFSSIFQFLTETVNMLSSHCITMADEKN